MYTYLCHPLQHRSAHPCGSEPPGHRGIQGDGNTQLWMRLGCVHQPCHSQLRLSNGFSMLSLGKQCKRRGKIQKVTKSSCTLQVFGGKVTMHICYVVIGWHPIKMLYQAQPNLWVCQFVWKYGTPPYPIVLSSCVPLYKWQFLIFRGMTWVAEWKVLHTSCHHFRAHHNHRLFHLFPWKLNS